MNILDEILGKHIQVPDMKIRVFKETKKSKRVFDKIEKEYENG